MFKKSVKTGYIEIFQKKFLPSLLEKSEKMSWKGHGKVIEFHSWISVWTMQESFNVALSWMVL